MTEPRLPHESTHRWYARPVFFVADLQRSLQFYITQLGFSKAWHEADGAGTVCQVARSECEIILCEQPVRPGTSRLFVELTADGLIALSAEIAARGVPHRHASWGYEVIQIDDPDGNELLFPMLPETPAG